MSGVSNAVQYGTPIPAPLLRIQGVGPRIDVPGYRRTPYGAAVEPVESQQGENQQAERSGVGRLVDVTA